VAAEAFRGLSGWMEAKGLYRNSDVQAYFNKKVHGILKGLNRTMIGWDEISDGNLPSDVVIQSWRGREALHQVVRRGGRGILSHGFYLDHLEKSAAHYAVDPQGLELGTESNILGGEACMWAELTSHENIESRIWPRALAVAERLWSPRTVQDVQDMHRRLWVTDTRLGLLGLSRHLENSRRMLQRLAPMEDLSSVELLASLLEPTGLHERNPGHSPRYTALTPLNRLADALLAESKSAQQFNGAVGIIQRFLPTRGNATALSIWAAKHDSPEFAQSVKHIRASLMAWKTLDSIALLAHRNRGLHEAAEVGIVVAAMSRLILPALPHPLGSVRDGVEDGTGVKLGTARVLLQRMEAACRSSEITLGVLPGLKSLLHNSDLMP